ncbi:MAG: hypothetical protein RR472_08025 [Anaerovoracaceae bacterium]
MGEINRDLFWFFPRRFEIKKIEENNENKAPTQAAACLGFGFISRLLPRRQKSSLTKNKTIALQQVLECDCVRFALVKLLLRLGPNFNSCSSSASALGLGLHSKYKH